MRTSGKILGTLLLETLLFSHFSLVTIKQPQRKRKTNKEPRFFHNWPCFYRINQPTQLEFRQPSENPARIKIPLGLLQRGVFVLSLKSPYGEFSIKYCSVLYCIVLYCIVGSCGKGILIHQRTTYGNS